LAKHFDAKLIGFAAAEPSNMVAGGAGAIAMAAWYAGARHEIEMRLVDLEAEFHRHVPENLRLEW
jgi:hypothetical protein